MAHPSVLPPLDLLLALVSAAESPNLVEAGRRIGLSQPALSMQLKRLEGAVQFPIFQVDGRRKVLTPFGHRLVKAAKNGLEGLSREWESALREMGDPNWLVLRVAARRELHPRILDRLEFSGRIHLFAMGSHEAAEAVLHGEVDMAVSHERPDSDQLVARKLFSQGVSLVVHKKWVTGGKPFDPVNAEFLTSTPALIYRHEAPLLREWFLHVGLLPSQAQVRVICEDWSLLYQRAVQGDGYVILPDMMDKGDNPDDVLHLRLSAQAMPTLAYYAIYRPALTRLPAFRRLLAERGRRVD